MGRDARSSRSPARPLPDAVRADPDVVSLRLRRAVRNARPRIFRPRRDLRVLGRGGAAISTRSRPPNHVRRRMVDRRTWGRPAGSRARAFSCRRVWTRRDHPRSGRAPPAGRHVEALSPSRRRSRAGRRCACARRRDRPRPRRRGSAVRARRQCAHAVGDLLCRREPACDDTRVPRVVRVAPGSSGRQLSVPPVGSSAGDRPDRRVGPDGRRAHARRPQRCLLRALVPCRPDGCRAGGGSRPRVPRQSRVHAHDRRRRAGARRVPAGRRRISGSAPFPRRLDAGLRGARQRRESRQRRDRELRRQRRRRRQGGVSVRSGDDRVLPGREARARQRRDLRPRRSRRSRAGRSRASTAWCGSPSTARAVTGS